MKILDIRGNLIKIESSKPIQVSSLLKITDNENNYLAQVLYAEQAGIANVVFAKILGLLGVQSSEPIEIESVSLDAACEKISLADVKRNFGSTQDIVLGELAYDNIIPTASKEFFDNKILIVSENNKCSDLLINNFAHQIKNTGHKTIILDTQGTCSGIKLTAGLDFKLPLNAHSIGFIYENYFSDITDASKALITDIFNELKEYATTVPYIPFKIFKNVIDQVLDYSQNLSLYFFKTKLERLYQAGIFANTSEEVMDWDALSEVGAATIIVDLSKISKLFTREYVSLITNSFNEANEKIYAFLKLDESFADKEFLKELIENEHVLTSCVIPSNFKFLPALKQNFGSFVVMGGIKKPDNFDYCKFLLKNLPNDKYVITGEFTAPLSLIFQLKEVNDVIPKQTVVQPTQQAPIEEVLEEETISENTYEEIQDIEDEEVSPVIETPIEEYAPSEPPSEDTDIDAETELESEPVHEDNIIEKEENETELSSEEEESNNIFVSQIDSEEIIENTKIQEIIEEPENSTEEIFELETTEEEPKDIHEINPEYEETQLVDNPEDEDFSDMTIEDYEPENISLDDNLQLEAELLDSLPEPEDFDLPELDHSEMILEEPEKTEEELLDEQIRRDVDRVYMAPPKEETEELSEDDLDFIEELVDSEDIIVEELPEPDNISTDLQEPEMDFLEQQTDKEEIPLAPSSGIATKNTSTPAVPIYAAEIPQDAMVQSDPIQQGDRVIHVKFGIGVVEKIFSYGTKNFCSINFENIGRKVLDPNVTELKKA